MKPEKVFRIGPVSASVFVNEVETEVGERLLRNVNLQRRYRNEESGHWKSSSSFSLAELPQAITALEIAMQYVIDWESDTTG